MESRLWNKIVSDRVKVKICGIDNIGFALDCYKIGIDALGFHIWRQKLKNDMEKGRINNIIKIVSILPADISKVLVTNIYDIGVLSDIIGNCEFDSIQIHEYLECENLCQIAKEIRKTKDDMKIIGVVGIGNDNAPDQIREEAIRIAGNYSKICDAILIDSSWKGGSGRTHDWSISKYICNNVECPCILAGGLRHNNVIDAIDTVGPYGVDIESGVEYMNSYGDECIKSKSVILVKEIYEAVKLKS